MGKLMIVLVGALWACQPAAKPVAVERDTPAPPLTLTVEGPKDVPARGPVEVRVNMHRIVAGPRPIRLRVDLPKGVVLREGSAREEVTDGVSLDIERVYVIDFEGVPSDDVRVEARWEGEGWGVVASGHYRFGRPEPVVPPPTRRGPALTVGGLKAGSGIPVTPVEGK